MQFYMYFYFITSASDLSDAFLIFSSNKEIYKNIAKLSTTVQCVLHW